jgi:hypothetical protein
MKRLLRIILYLTGILILTLAIFLVVVTLKDYRPAANETLYQSSGIQSRLDTGQTYTIMTWNIGYGGLGKDMDFFYDGGSQVRPALDDLHRNMENIMELVHKGRLIDFMIIQEVDLDSRRSYHTDQLEMIHARLDPAHLVFAKNYDVPFVPLPLLNPMGKVLAGQVNVSKYLPVESTRHAFPGNYPWPRGLFLLDRCFILDRYFIEGDKELVIINTHNSAFDDGRLRMEQLNTLVDILKMEYVRGNYVIAGGDWNMNPPGFDPSLIYTSDATMTVEPVLEEGSFPEGWTLAYDPQVPTNRDVSQPYLHGSTPVTIIDFFVCSPNVEVVDVKGITLMFEHADHNPVVMQFKLQ